MNRRLILRKAVFWVLFAGLLPVFALGQRTDESIKVKVRRSEGGQISQMEEELPAAEGEDLENLLKKYGVEDELGELQPGEEVEITIRRKSPATADDVNIKVDREPKRTEVPVENMVSRAFLGVHYEMNYGDVIGSRINTVVTGTPAERAALRRDDIITAVDGERLFVLEDLARIVSRHRPGDRVMLSIVRDGKRREYPVTLGERKEHFFAPGNSDTGYHYELNFDEMMPGMRVDASAGRAFLGVTFMRSNIHINGRDISPDNAELTISSVVAHSTAAEMGLEPGDVIRSIDGISISSYRELTEVMAGTRPGDQLALSFERNGRPMVVSGTLKASRPGMHRHIEHDFDELHRYLEDKGEKDDDGGSIHDRVRAMINRMEAEDNRKVREFSIVIRMDEVTAQEAQALTEKSGQQFSAQNNLEVAELKLAPNPSNGMFSVIFDLPQRGTAELRVIDVNGQIIYQETMNDFQGRYRKEFDISGKSKGIYYMQITQNGRTFSRKIVTQ
ncbi:MAG: PDZ domain-containing protein [Bacteroidota bacterium]